MINKIKLTPRYIRNTHYSKGVCIGTKMDYLQILRLKKIEKRYADTKLDPLRITHIILN